MQTIEIGKTGAIRLPTQPVESARGVREHFKSGMSLTRYIQKRNFKRTPEPKGGSRRGVKIRSARMGAARAARKSKSEEAPKPGGEKATKLPNFVIQFHDARHLHFDFRLEMEGVLKSWSVPKGLPTKRGDRRLAMEVEDHPLEYGGFEGTIPEGNYGAGTVMLWDRGTYEVMGGEPLRAYHQGKIHFVLHGKKLVGEWALVKMHPREKTEKPAWLIFKAVEDFKGEVEDRSVLSGKTLDEIAGTPGKVWQSNRVAASADGDGESSRRGHSEVSRFKAETAEKKSVLPNEVLSRIKALPRERPAPAIPMKALLVEKAPEEPGWIYEIKWDGYRALAVKRDNEAKLFSRHLREVTPDFPGVAQAVKALPGSNFVLDGEIVALDESGHPSFHRLQNFRRHAGAGSSADLYYYVFDLLNLENHNTKGLGLEERKGLLQEFLEGAPDSIRFSASLEGQPKLLLAEAQKNRVEGLVAKRRDGPYLPGRRSRGWIKIKLALEQEFVIGGYTAPRGARDYFGSVVVGYYRDGELIFASKVGTGFDSELLETLHKKFQPLKTEECPFANLPSPPEGEGLTRAEMRRCTWLEPKLVCQAWFTEWTEGGGLRQPVFLGLRDDKEPKEVVREMPVKV